MSPDPTGHDPLLRALAWLHPAWMLASLTGLALTLRAGLALRGARRRRVRRDPEQYRRHLRRAKPTLVLILVGFGLGLASSVWLRGWEVLRSAHGAVTSLALLLFAALWWSGRRLEAGLVRGGQRGREVERHAWLALLATLAAGAAFGTGFVLLP